METVRNRFILVRHGAISAQWKGICYGCQDVPLCERWMAESEPLVQQLASLRPATIFHSGLSRASWLADQVRQIVQNQQTCEVVEDFRLRERNFGQWEGMMWDDVYASDPENFHGLIDKPDTYRPPSGETTNELQRRVVHWYQQCNQDDLLMAKPVLAVTHSGPIAALTGHLLGLTPEQWTPWMLGYGEIVTISSKPSFGNGVDIKKGWQSDLHS
jgi:broad specificity phosphatase PhoE